MDQHLFAIGAGLNDLGPALDQKMAAFGRRSLTEDPCSLLYTPDLPSVEDRLKRSRVETLEQFRVFEDRRVNHFSLFKEAAGALLIFPAPPIRNSLNPMRHVAIMRFLEWPPPADHGAAHRIGSGARKKLS
jgi:hypothetical protein